MKTKEEIIKNSLKVNENYQVNNIIDQITEGLNSRVQQGYKSFEYVFGRGTMKQPRRCQSTSLRDLIPWGSTLGSVGGKRRPTETKDR